MEQDSLAVNSIHFKGSIKALLKIISKLSTETADQSQTQKQCDNLGRKPSKKEALKRQLQVPSLFSTMQDSYRDTFGGTGLMGPRGCILFDAKSSSSVEVGKSQNPPSSLGTAAEHPQSKRYEALKCCKFSLLLTGHSLPSVQKPYRKQKKNIRGSEETTAFLIFYVAFYHCA